MPSLNARPTPPVKVILTLSVAALLGPAVFLPVDAGAKFDCEGVDKTLEGFRLEAFDLSRVAKCDMQVEKMKAKNNLEFYYYTYRAELSQRERDCFDGCQREGGDAADCAAFAAEQVRKVRESVVETYGNLQTAFNLGICFGKM